MLLQGHRSRAVKLFSQKTAQQLIKGALQHAPTIVRIRDTG
jgi:hypothetical protein